jgi:hypothetical protein
MSDAHHLPVSRFIASVGSLQESVVAVGGKGLGLPHALTDHCRRRDGRVRPITGLTAASTSTATGS